MTAMIRMNEARMTAAAEPAFVHLKVHSAYSLLEGAITIAKLAKLAVAQGFPALGLTDSGNLFGALEFSDKLAAAGVQPNRRHDAQGRLRGAGPRRAWPPARARACHGRGHRAHCLQRVRLSKPDAALFAGVPRSRRKRAAARHAEPAAGDRAQGLIALTGGPDGPINRALGEEQRELAGARLTALAAIYGDRLYVELQRHGLAQELKTEPELIALAYARSVPIVASNEVYFASPDDYEAHDALLCIAEGSYVTEDNRRRLSREHYFKSAQEMARLFADLPEALANSIEIAKRCAFRPLGRKPILPKFVVAAKGASEAEQLALEAKELRRQAQAGLEQRLATTPLAPGFTAQDYEQRLAFEVDVISRMKYPGYFLIVADFIKWAKANGIPVGPGRGSGAGSVVAWALTITDLDPLRFGLLFERFLTRNACRCRTSTSTFARIAATRSFATYRANTAPIGWRRSSLTASCRRARCCAMWAACCRCPTVRSIGFASSFPTIPPIP
jgi:DNA polymerase-3 subunit alpha